jgi:hypothetical protein
MKFDFKKTLELIKGGLLNPNETWASYLAENQDWKSTLIILTGPLILANIILSLLLSRMMGTLSPFVMGGNWFSALIFGLVMAAIGFAVAVFVFSFLAGTFGGKASFSRAFAAVSLAAIPAWVGGIIGAAIPWVGGLISLAGGIVSLVFLYKIMPLALEVPENNRVLHFVASLVVVIVINMIIGSVLGFNRMGSQSFNSSLGKSETRSGADNVPGMFGEIGRQADLMAKAGEDSYTPPDNGKVSLDQSRWFTDVISKAEKAREEEAARLQKLSKEMEDKENPSPADLARIYQGMGSAVSLSNVEMEVVKTGGGNWAEFQWIKEQLRVARLQQGEGSEALAHNFAIYQEISDKVGDSL